MKTYRIHLIRHGLTEGNLKGQYVGQTDLPITTDGINELQMLKDKYGYPHAELFFSSPLTRCLQTLEVLYKGAAVTPVADLAECNFGVFEGKTFDELKGDPIFEEWVTTGGAIAPPNGESSSEFASRCLAAFNSTVESILKSGKTDAVICAHGGVFMTILANYGLPQREIFDWMCSNGRGYTIRITPSIWMRGGMFEVISDLPVGSNSEKDNSINPVLKARKK